MQSTWDWVQYHKVTLCTTKQKSDNSGCKLQPLWCKPRWEGMWCSANMFDFCSACFGHANPVSASAIFAPFNLQLKPESVYINGWIQNCTLTAPTSSMCSALNHPSGGSIWKILSGLCRQGTCNAGVGKTPRYPTEVWSCSGYFQRARVLHHFRPGASGAPLWCCTTICWRTNRQMWWGTPSLARSLARSLSGCNRDWFLCLSLMTLYDCCV